VSLGFFFVVNNGATVIYCNPQIMKCVVYREVEMDVDAHNFVHVRNNEGFV
jgi:hypothetical protein